MDQTSVDAVTKDLLADIRAHLKSASKISKAADKFAQDGDVQHALRMVMDFEDLAFQAQESFKAALLINRMSRHE